MATRLRNATILIFVGIALIVFAVIGMVMMLANSETAGVTQATSNTEHLGGGMIRVYDSLMKEVCWVSKSGGALVCKTCDEVDCSALQYGSASQ